MGAKQKVGNPFSSPPDNTHFESTKPDEVERSCMTRSVWEPDRRQQSVQRRSSSIYPKRNRLVQEIIGSHMLSRLAR